MNELKIILKEFSELPIAYQPVYAKISGSVTAGILLSQLIYWHYAMKEQEFYKTDKEFCEELAMGKKELKNAKKMLVGKHFINHKRRGTPPKTHYSVNIENVISGTIDCAEREQLIVPKRNNQLCRKGTIDCAEREQSSIQRIHTENTPENTTDIFPAPTGAGKKQPNEIKKEKPSKKSEMCLDGEMNKQIPELINVFKSINPMISFSHPGIRKSSYRLIKQFGFENAISIAKTAMSVQNQEYSPVITTPGQLISKLGALAALVGRKKNKMADTNNDECLNSLRSMIDDNKKETELFKKQVKVNKIAEELANDFNNF